MYYDVTLSEKRLVNQVRDAYIVRVETSPLRTCVYVFHASLKNAVHGFAQENYGVQNLTAKTPICVHRAFLSMTALDLTIVPHIAGFLGFIKRQLSLVPRLCVAATHDAARGTGDMCVEHFRLSVNDILQLS